MTPFTSILAHVLYNLTNSAIYWCEIHMKRVIKVSQAWIAALFLGLVLTGCGGGSSGSSESTAGTGDSTGVGSGGSEGNPPPSGGGEGVVDRSASLSWNAPTDRENGDDLSPYDLERYVIRYGTDRNNLDKQVQVDNVGGLETMSYDVRTCRRAPGTSRFRWKMLMA